MQHKDMYVSQFVSKHITLKCVKVMLTSELHVAAPNLHSWLVHLKIPHLLSPHFKTHLGEMFLFLFQITLNKLVGRAMIK